jgi:hypothetical protein
MTTVDNDVTDVDEYCEEHPEYVECREEHHDWHAMPGHANANDLLVAYDDAQATHHKLAQCTRCKMKRVKRRVLVIRRGKLASLTKLPTRYDKSECADYGAKGIKITSTVLEERQARRMIENEAAAARSTRAAAASKPRTASPASRRRAVA